MAMKTLLAALSAVALATAAEAQEHRELDAHVHGVSKLEVALEHGTLTLDLHAPGMDIVGFEYAAASDADRDTVATAVMQLTRPHELIVPEAGAQCRITEILAHLHGEEHDHEETDAHAAHEDDDEDEAHEGEEHAHDDETHEGEDAGGEHSEFHARYAFDCAHPEALQAIAFPFFTVFANAAEIEATVVTETGAFQAEIEPEAPTLSLR
ncbi:MAG: DUF2796 domain-containing protein [Acuticoccus sp.]